MTRIRTAASGLALAATLLSIVWLARLEASGPEIVQLTLDGAIPASLALPNAAGSEATREETRAPAVVLAHGIAADRFGMSVLARALTQAGYAVLSFDFRGHGANRNPFVRRGGRKQSLVADLRSAVDFLRTSPDVDGSRISIIGHSMGAGAALAYAGIDPALDATVMISGGWRANGPHRPANALFLYGASDPARIRERSASLTAQLGGVERAEVGRVFGSFAASTAVSHVQVARAGHITILGSQVAARRIIDWLDESYGVERGTFFLRADPRVRTALLGLLAFVFVLPGLGAVVGRLSPRLAERPSQGVLGRIAMLAFALLATLPLVSVGDLQRVVPLAIGNTVVLHLFAAGSLLLVWLRLRDRFACGATRADLGRAVAAAGVGIIAVVLLLSPLGAVLHGLGLTPERGAVGVGVALLIAPFQLAFHELLRRGGTLAAMVASSIGRAVLLAVLGLGVWLTVLPGVVTLMLPILALLFVLFEILSSAVYATARNPVVPALLESAWLAWILAAVLPITV